MSDRLGSLRVKAQELWECHQKQINPSATHVVYRPLPANKECLIRQCHITEVQQGMLARGFTIESDERRYFTMTWGAYEECCDSWSKAKDVVEQYYKDLIKEKKKQIANLERELGDVKEVLNDGYAF